MAEQDWIEHSPTCTWYLDGACDCEEFVMFLDIKEEVDDDRPAT